MRDRAPRRKLARAVLRLSVLSAIALAGCHKANSAPWGSHNPAWADTDRLEALIDRRLGSLAQITEFNSQQGFKPPFCGSATSGLQGGRFVFVGGRLIMKGDIRDADFDRLVAEYCMAPLRPPVEQ